MKRETFRFLEAKRDLLVVEWEKNLSKKWISQIAAASLSGNKGGTRIPASSSVHSPECEEMAALLVIGFYKDLLSLAQNQEQDEMRRLAQKFPHYSPSGTRLTLSYFTEIFFAAEDVFAENLLKEGREKHGLTHTESIEIFEEIDRGLHAITQHYADAFCKECLAPLTNAIYRVLEGSQACKKWKWNLYEQNL